MVHATNAEHPETLRAVETLASGAAHHLNNLLAVVLAHLQLADMKAESPAIRRHLELAERAAQDSARVIRQLSRFGSARLVEPVLVDLTQLAREVLDSVTSGWREGGVSAGPPIAVRVETTPVPRVLGDPPLLSEVLTNLVVNALDAMPRGGTLTVRTQAAGDRVFCSVSDTGVGMSPRIRERAVAPFFTTKGVRRMGLGLSVSHGIVRGHGGELTLDSVEGRGTTAAFYLPVAAAEAAVSAGRSA
jgi:signal transduction histidine kinase